MTSSLVAPWPCDIIISGPLALCLVAFQSKVVHYVGNTGTLDVNTFNSAAVCVVSMVTEDWVFGRLFSELKHNVADWNIMEILSNFN